MKRVIVTAPAVGLLTLGTAGVASAQTTGGSSTSPSTASPNGSTKHRHHRGALAVLRVSAKTLGVQPRDLVTALCGGQPLEALAGPHGKPPPAPEPAPVPPPHHPLHQPHHPPHTNP